VSQRPSSDAPEFGADEQAGTSRLHVALAVEGDLQRAIAALGARRATWVGELVEPAGDDAADRYLMDLELRVSDSAPRVAFHKAAYVDVGPISTDDEQARVDISWRAASLTPLFPVFAGELRWRNGQLQLDGYYAPPGGGVGVLADRLLLNVAARATGRRLLERIAETMGDGG
jgi:hypothetical protein